MDFGYYPGCALHGSSYDYDKSVRACMNHLQIGLHELDDWICCGATAAHNINKKLAVALPARNLAIAERDGIEQLFAPCPMCSMELIKVGNELKNSETLRNEMSQIVENTVAGKTEIVNLIQIFQKIGLEKLTEAVTKKLDGYKPACYYGCLLTRPPKDLKFDDCEQPSSMEILLRALGAEPVDNWNYKTECCGAGLTLADDSIVTDLSGKILRNAKKHGANCMVVACPMCHVNLDMKQPAIEKKYKEQLDLPVYYLSDLVGIALGISEKELCLDKHFVKTKPHKVTSKNEY
ncbi:MAG: CoB--CoM heterodisulfide reductase iron-sulfur subunit B family protein [Planctomycetaceae bacterium]|jgi:heterodisulfide reductase subunit B|nr:CoB--CoM heterodisulfide reductase iron-sulfur subunit B family protein [Planctomycetaceae bacterium]